MKILFVLSNFHPYIGGSEIAFRKLTEGLASKGHSIEVITSALPNAAEDEMANGVRIRRIRIPSIAYQFLFTFYCLKDVIRQARQYDLIHTASNYSALAAFIAGRITRKPVVLTCHEVLGRRWFSVEAPWKAFLFRLIEYLTLKLPYSKYAAVSGSTQNDLRGIGVRSDRISVVPWGVNDLFADSPRKGSRTHTLKSLVGAEKRDLVYVYFGRPGATKGVEYLVRAAPRIKNTLPDSRLVLILSTEPKKRYERVVQLIDALKIGHYVHLVDPIPNRSELAVYLSSADCIVVPSLTEGFGFTTVEACSLAVPVVASRVGPIPDLIFGKYVLIEPGSADAIHDGVVQAMRGEYETRCDPPALSWQDTLMHYENIYRQVIPTS